MAGRLLAEEPVSVGVVLKFERTPPHDFLLALQQEFAEIMLDACCRLHWVAPEKNSATWDRAFVVRFRGNCVAGEGLPPNSRVTLAQAPYQEGSILPYADVDCDQLRDFLNTTAASRFGRATGRLLAHELYHVLLQTHQHSKKGIAKAVQTPAALLSRSLRFQSEDLERFRSMRLALTRF